MTIQKNRAVAIEYTLTDESGVLIETSEGREPLTYARGGGNIIPGLEASLEGETTGQTLKVSVPPEAASGEWDQEKIIEIPKTQFSAVDDVQVGMGFGVHSSTSEKIVTVTKLVGDTVNVDANHPLAGKTLNFEVKVVDVGKPTPGERDHGHAHGPGGHH
jgi:FKBP-type peptidyl-prolyl cis-trans isomerase SlyD